ncbi:MAG: hypothetical protein Q9208_004153 [Pyrenodesmia sp. 3 TL-2023]
MAAYDSALHELEELARSRIDLAGRGRTTFGIDKGIGYQLADLRRGPSLSARADDYCRRLKIVRNQLGGHAALELQQLISEQESSLPGARPNVGKPRSPPPPPLIRPQWRSAQVVNDITTPGVSGNRTQQFPLAERDAPPLIRPRGRRTVQFQSLQASGNPRAAHDTPATNVDTRRVLEPPILNIFVRRLDYRKGSYRHRNGYKPMKVKIGGANSDEYSGITHPLLRNPEKIGSVLWNRDSSLIVAHSNDHIRHVRGDTLHIEAYNQENAVAFVRYMRQLAPNGHVQIFEIPQ